MSITSEFLQRRIAIAEAFSDYVDARTPEQASDDGLKIVHAKSFLEEAALIAALADIEGVNNDGANEVYKGVGELVDGIVTDFPNRWRESRAILHGEPIGN